MLKSIKKAGLAVVPALIITTATPCFTTNVYAATTQTSRVMLGFDEADIVPAFDGKGDTLYTGVVDIGEEYKIYIKDGKFASEFTGKIYRHDPDDLDYLDISYVKNGYVIHEDYGRCTNGWVLQDLSYLKNEIEWFGSGMPTADKSFLGAMAYDGKICYMENGTFKSSVNGLADGKDGNWYYFKKGVVDSEYTGYCADAYGEMFYVKKGVVDFSRPSITKGIITNTDGTLCYVDSGVVNTSINGLVDGNNGNWYYVTNGIVNSDYTGYCADAYGEVFFIENGVVNFNHQ